MILVAIYWRTDSMSTAEWMGSEPRRPPRRGCSRCTPGSARVRRRLAQSGWHRGSRFPRTQLHSDRRGLPGIPRQTPARHRSLAHDGVAEAPSHTRQTVGYPEAYLRTSTSITNPRSTRAETSVPRQLEFDTLVGRRHGLPSFSSDTLACTWFPPVRPEGWWGSSLSASRSARGK